MPYRNEDLERAIDARLQGAMAAALLAVVARWAEIDDVALTEPVSWYRGYRSLLLETPSSSFPIVWTWAHQRAPVGGVKSRMQGVRAEVAIQVWLAEDTEAIANTVGHRYTEAIIDILQAQKVIGGWSQVNFEPAAEQTQSIVHLRAGSTGDYENANDIDYIRMVEVTVIFESLDTI